MAFWASAQSDPSRLSLVEPDGTEWRAGELLAASNRLAHGLRSRGIGVGDTIAALLPNGAPMVQLYLAALQTGIYLVPINYHLAPPEVAYIVTDSDAKAFFSDPRYATTVDKADFGAPRFTSLAELQDGRPDTLPDDRTAGATTHYTSGTTGQPKGVRRPLSGLDPDMAGDMFAAFNMLFGIMPDDGNVHLVVSPMYHTAVMNFSTGALNMGHTVVQMDRWTPEETLRLIERYRVTTSHMVPTQFHRLLALPDDVKSRYDLSSLRVMIHSAAPCPVEIKQRMLDWWGPVIYEYYAATEGGGTLVTPEQWLKKPGTVGTAWPMSTLSIRDDDGNELPPNEVGTVWMSMGGIRFEYHKDREKTERTWRDDFFTVGDAGYLDEDGYLFLCDRKSDMIISGGVNIYPAEIEGVLLTHPKIGDAGVFGIPDDDWGEQVKAVVEPASGVEPRPELAEEILAFCKDKLAGYKIPKSIDFHAQLPRDPNGKLYKRKLRDPYWAGREKAI